MSDEKEPPAQSALKETADFLRLSSGLVTGTIAVSFIFLNGSVSVPTAARGWLYAAWILLCVSALTSILAYAVIPPKFEDKDYTLHDTTMNVIGTVHLGSYFLGFLLLVIGVGIFVGVQPVPEHDAVKSAQEAARLSLSYFPPQPAVVNVRRIELIKGTDSTRSDFSTWWVHADVTVQSHQPKTSSRAASTRELDVFINAESGKVSSIP